MTIAIALAVIAGLLIGSFLTVVADRVPRGESIVQPGSACGNCGLRLGPLDLIPVFSWLALGGKCRKCHVSIGIEPLVLELSTALLFGITAWQFGGTWRTAAYCVLMAGLVVLSWIDLHIKRLPREITYTTLAIGAPLLCVSAFAEDDLRRIGTMVLGAAIALALMGLIRVASRGGLGDGDVRLSPLLGAYLGWLNPGLVPVGLFFGFLLGAIVSLVLLAFGRVHRRTAVPFGPFLALGAVVAIFLGQSYIDMLLGR